MTDGFVWIFDILEEQVMQLKKRRFFEIPTSVSTSWLCHHLTPAYFLAAVQASLGAKILARTATQAAPEQVLVCHESAARQAGTAAEAASMKPCFFPSPSSCSSTPLPSGKGRELDTTFQSSLGDSVL